jgi:Protein of unknown function (DUF2628)
MAIYTVHQPPLKSDQSAPDPERFAFVRDGFSFWAFLLAPLWMLRHRLWLVFVGYFVLAIVLQIGLRAIGASGTVMVVVGILLALLVGFEAATLRRFTLARRRWDNVGIVVGDDLEAAERRFFDAWVKGAWDGEPWSARGPRAPLRPATAVSILRKPQSPSAAAPEVIGLFPEPGAPR